MTTYEDPDTINKQVTQCKTIENYLITLNN